MSRTVLFVVKEIEGAEPLGALYVAGCLRQAGHECRFVGTRGNDVAAEVRRFGPRVIAFGATTGLDVICRGEGEDAAVELADALDRGADHRAIRDLWVKHEGAIFRNPPREL